MPEKVEKSKQRPRSADRLQHELLVAYRTVDGFITDWEVDPGAARRCNGSGRKPAPQGSNMPVGS